MKLTDQQGVSLMSAFLLGNVLSGIGSSSSGVKTGYLSVWLSMLFFVLFSILFQWVLTKNKGENFHAISEQLFRKTGAKILLIFVALYSFLSGFLSILNYLDFIRDSVTTDFPVFLGLLAVLLLTVFLCLKHIKTLGRYAEITLPIVIGSIIILLILGLKNHPQHTFPLPDSLSNFVAQGWQIFCSPFMEITFLWILFDSFEHKERIGKISIKAGLLTTGVFSLIYLFNVNILGEKLLQQTRFPTFFSASLVEVGTIMDHAESLITLSYSFCDILYGSLCLFVGVNSVCKLINSPPNKEKRNKKITALIAVIFLFVWYCFFGAKVDLREYYPVISIWFLPFTMGLPILLALVTMFKTRKHQ